MANLFIVHTPYHLILACGLCKNQDDENSDLFIYKDFDISSIDIKSVETVFNNIYIYDKNNYRKVSIPKLKTIVMIKSKFKNIKKLLKYRYDKLFVFNETLPETQYIINKNRNCKVFYVEDGSNAYASTNTNSGINRDNIKALIRNYIYYGFKYEDVGHTFGTHSKIQKRMVVWPQIVREELQRDNLIIEEITKDILDSGITICYNHLVNSVEKKEEKVFILLEHIEFFTMYKNADITKYKDIIEKIIALNSGKVYVKYHPRDNSEYLKDIIVKYSNVKIVDNNQPAEVYYISNNISIVAVCSTTLFTAAKILPTMNIISLANIMNMKDKELIDKFISIGVQVPNKCCEVIEIIEKTK